MANHKTGYNRTWKADHTWVFYNDGEGMYCKLCRKFYTKNRQNQAKVWNTEPCTTLQEDVLARHEASAMHKEAVEQERACQIVNMYWYYCPHIQMMIENDEFCQAGIQALLLFSLGEGRGRGMLPDPHNIRIYL